MEIICIYVFLRFQWPYLILGEKTALGLSVLHPNNDKAVFYVKTGKLTQIYISKLIEKM